MFDAAPGCRFKASMDRAALNELTKGELIELVLAQETRHAAEMAGLRERIAELQRRLGLNSGNSGKPPSSDGLKKPPRVGNLRQPSGKQTGGQPGHPGKTLRRAETPDTTVDHYPQACTACGTALTAAMATDHVARPLVVTEHRAHTCRCAACGRQTRAAFPDEVTAPVQYSTRVAAFMLYLLHYQLLPEKRLAEAMADLFGVALVTATIARISRDAARRCQSFADAVRDQVAAAPVKHLDETGFRIGGKTQWLHMASTVLLTFYRISPKRGSLLANVTGIVVHDHWKPYYTLEGVLHALCNAHHLRELKALVEIEEDWARRMQRLLRRACHATNLARDRGMPLKPSLIARIERCYDAILAEGLAFHAAQPALVSVAVAARHRGRPARRVGHNLLLRLSTRKQDVLRFLTDPPVPFTNNLVERDGRMMKLRQKISGGFRSEAGAEDFAVIRSLLSTARKQGWGLLQTLTSDPKHLIARLRLA
ncbi:MAG TPA: IS66 family transposase [Acidobacteriaceae bacterium]|nr:IS66 family transposase [Acidobacteriaceae bacterium]